ncbi:DUF3131 domain-containing protein [Paracoccus salipaludis]|nr:DUF3131 domain-containing protein [Paracoccus salipaludis]
MTRRLTSAAILALAGSASLAVVLTITGAVPAVSQPALPQPAAPAAPAAQPAAAAPAPSTATLAPAATAPAPPAVAAPAAAPVPAAPAGATAPTPAQPQPAAAPGDLNAAMARPFGRHGPLTERERAMAETAWQYFVKSYQPDTGLVNAVGSYPSTTLWDTGSYISALVAARELRLIDKREFDLRANLLIKTLRNLDLFRGEMPNKVYNTKTGQKVDYANKPGEVGHSVLDIGRMLVWLKILKERYPYLAPGIDATVLRWNFCNTVKPDGSLFGSVLSKGETRYVQEGRLGYEQYAAKGFELWGFGSAAALSPDPLEYTEIFGVRVPIDGRDPRIFGNMNYVLTESYLLDGLELGWKLPGDMSNDTPGLATQGWRAEFANRIYLVQQRRFEETGIMTARSEHQVDGAPFFVYDSIWANGFAWSTLDPSDVYRPERAAIAAKAAIGMWALWETPYTDLLMEAVGDLSTEDGGFYEGLYENGNGYIPLQTANNNGIILAALLYKEQGPILQHLNTNTQVWDTAFTHQDTRANRCLPQPKPVQACCNCQAAAPEPGVPAADFLYCRPVVQADGSIAATACGLEPHGLPAPVTVAAAATTAQMCPLPPRVQP